MRRRTVLLGLAAATLPLPALALPPPRWRSMSKRRFGPTRAYSAVNMTVRLPVVEDVPAFPMLALKLYGGPLWLSRVEYLYADQSHESHWLEIPVVRNEIAALPAPARRLISVDVVSEPFTGGNRYWHLVGTSA